MYAGSCVSPDIRALTVGKTVVPTTRLPAQLPIASAAEGANYMGIGRVRMSNGRTLGRVAPGFTVKPGAVTALRNGTITGVVIPVPFPSAL